MPGVSSRAAARRQGRRRPPSLAQDVETLERTSFQEENGRRVKKVGGESRDDQNKQRHCRPPR